MAEGFTPPQSPLPQDQLHDNEQDKKAEAKRHISPGRSALASAMATLALWGVAGGPKAEFKIELPEVSWQYDEHGQRTVTEEHQRAVEGAHSMVAREVWAREFAQDPAAGELIDPSDVARITNEITMLRKSGFTVRSMDIRGYASDEDDTVDADGVRTAGLQVENPKNPELGDKRATVLEVLLAEKLGQRGETLPPITELPSVEDLLTDDEVAQIDTYTERFGYESPTTMIEQFNRDPASTPPEVVDYLNQVLRSERKVEITIYYDKMVSTKETHTEPYTIHHQGREKRVITVEIPLFLLIPVLAPEAVVVPIPEPVPTHEAKDALYQKQWGKAPEDHSATAYHQRQPREHNMHKRRSWEGGKIDRSHGGDRRSKRG
ncbi:hypothetical protein IT414_00745 [bacterium]|nr:hypothetical protein [bacterium]